MSDSRSNNGGGKGRPIILSGGEATSRALPLRFYRNVEVGPADAEGAHPLLLDGRPARTPAKRELRLASAPLARAVADEWTAQSTHIDPASMPLTRLVNTALDGVAARMAEVAADVVKYVRSDLLCYRADYPERLAARQAELWDPILDWVADRFGTRLAVVCGVMPVEQPTETGGIADAVGRLDALQLTALHVMTTLMGSALLALAVLEGRLAAGAAWEAAHVDEDWQIAEWGEDSEARARRERRRQEMEAAAALLRLVEA